MTKAKLAVGAVFAVWLAVIFILGAAGTFDTPEWALPLPLMIGVGAPIVIFLVLHGTVAGFRNWVLAADLRLATGCKREITTDPMGRLPLVLIPCYLVPLFTMLHLTAMFQVRQLARGKISAPQLESAAKA